MLADRQHDGVPHSVPLRHVGADLRVGAFDLVCQGLPDSVQEAGGFADLNVCADLRRQLHDNPGAEITVDLERNVVVAPDGKEHAFSIPGFNRERLLKGLDDVSFTLEREDDIAAYEAKRRADADWLFE